MYHTVLQALADGHQHTAEQLIKQCHLRMTDLKQAFNTLNTFGIRVLERGTNTYQLTEPVELLDHARILAALPLSTRQRLAQIEIHTVLDSTNQYALARYCGAVPFACLTEYQTAGRGRQGRQWISPYASGLCLSLKPCYTIPYQPLSGLNIALAVTVAQTLRTLGATEIGIKWPNDILWRGRKLAGLLLESRGAKKCHIVYGIGINVKMHTSDTKAINQPFVDLSSVLGHKCISRNTLAAKLIDHCLQTLDRYPQVGLTAFRQDWHRFDLSYGQSVTLQIPQNTFSKKEPLKTGQNTKNTLIENKEYIMGTACGIDDQGALLLQVGHQKRRYACGEVSLRL